LVAYKRKLWEINAGKERQMKIYFAHDRDDPLYGEMFLSEEKAKNCIKGLVFWDIKEYEIKDAPTVPQQPQDEICQCCGGNGFSNYNSCSTCNDTGKLSPVRHTLS
jgi:hypothetical protein